MRGQISDVDHDRETIRGRFRQWERPLPQLDRIHRRNGKAECWQLVGVLAHRDRPFLQALEKRALRLERDAVDFVEQNHFRRRERPELGDQLAGGGIYHLEPDYFSRLQVGSPLQPGELCVADGRQDDPEECLADTEPRQQQVARIDLTFPRVCRTWWDFRQHTTLASALAVS